MSVPSRSVAWTSLVLLALAAGAAFAQPPKSGGGVHYLYFVRHGDYDRSDRSADDVAENGLNALGHEQSRFIAARLAALPVRPAALVTSNFRRARETAEDIGAALGMTPTVDTLLHECTGTSDREDLMKRTHPAELAACDSNMARAWRKYVVPTPEGDRHDVLVCHGNVTRWFVCRAVAGDPRGWPFMDIANASLTILAVRPDGSARLVCYSDVGHLPLDKQTWLGKGAGWGVARAGAR